MKHSETTGKGKTSGSHDASGYRRAVDGSKRPVRGLWVRNGRFYLQMRVEENGASKPRRIPLTDADSKLPVASVAEARKAMEKLRVSRDANTLGPLRQTPRLADFVTTYLGEVSLRKRPRTVAKERHILTDWVRTFGQLRMDHFRKHHVAEYQTARLKAGLNPRTVNLDIIALRQLFKRAQDLGIVADLPMAGLRPLKSVAKRRKLVSAADITRLIETGRAATKNGEQLADYLTLLQLCGAREKEALRLRWVDVDFAGGRLLIGADGLAKNHESRHVDLHPALERHLQDMHARRAPDSQWLFPSPQRGDKDIHAQTFRESLRLARAAADLPGFGFHDLRHAFCSRAVMAGVDFMSIAKWAGHKDGGVLIGKVYGHLSDGHRKAMAAKLSI